MSRSFDMSITTGLDQTIERYPKDVVRKATDLIDSAADAKDFHKALDFIADLEAVAHASGVGLAVAFHQMLMRWEDFSGETFDTSDERQDHFEQVMFEKFGKAKNTIRRYLMAGSFLTSVPSRIGRLSDTKKQQIERSLPERAVIDLIAVGQYEREHGSLTPTQILEIAEAEDRSTVRRLLRRYRGDEEEHSLLRLTLLKDGTLEVTQNGNHILVGYLSRDSEITGLRERAVSRIIKRAGIDEE